VTGTRHIRITIRGRLTERLARAFDGLRVELRDGTTDLDGDLADQAQLHGVLARLRDLGLSIETMTVGDAVSPDGHDRVVGPT
jgi:hypothetical protein